VKTSFYEADPFSGNRGDHYLTIDTDYRFEKNDEVWLDLANDRVKIRITWVYVTVAEDGQMERDLLGMKL